MGTIKTTNIEPIADNGTVTLGSSGDTFTVPSGVTVNMSSATQTGVGGVMTPSFFASNTGNQNASSNTATKLAFSNEVWDVGGVYDHSTNYRFTPGFVGKSNISCGFWSYDAQELLYQQDAMLYKNGSQLTSFEDRYLGSTATLQRKWTSFSMNVSHDADDYFEMYGLFRTTDNNTADILSSSGNNAQFWNYFTAFKIIE